MRLKHIKLAGFKSFVDPTKVPFEQQMTAIVGPNGCGKSNIIDAVRWVLGESSAKNLRGDAMTDVIFNGAASRKPIGQASVELVFDNSKGRIQGDMANRNEVSIRRIVNRESTNSYYLNGSKCRRKDITDLFLGTGLGPRSYAIIEQGTISRLIESKPQDLRIFIEEAAGISKYKERRRETENRIKQTRENLVRLNDIRLELTSQLEHLHQQAESAKHYKTLKTHERKYKAELAVMRWQKFTTASEEHQLEATKLQTLVEQLIQQQKVRDISLFQAKQSMLELSKSTNVLQQKKLALTKNIARAEQDIKHGLLQKNKIEKENNHSQQQLAHAQKSVITQQNKISEIAIVVNNKEEELHGVEGELAVVQEHLQQLSIEQQHEQQLWQQKNIDYNASVKKHVSLKENIAKQQTIMSTCQQKIDSETAFEKNLAHEILADVVKINELKAKELSLTTRLKEQTSEQTALLKIVQKTDEKIYSLNQTIAKNTGSQQVLINNIALIEQQNNQTEWQIAQSNVLTEQGIKLLGSFYQQLVIDEKWIKAVEIVLASWLPAQCVNDFPKNLLVESLLLIKPQSSNIKAVAGTLAEKVSGEQHFTAQLNQILIADNVALAQKMLADIGDSQSIICPDGTWLSHHFIRKGNIEGSDSPLQRAEQLSHFKAELNQLEQNLSADKQVLEQLMLSKTEHQELLAIANLQLDNKKRAVDHNKQDLALAVQQHNYKLEQQQMILDNFDIHRTLFDKTALELQHAQQELSTLVSFEPTQQDAYKERQMKYHTDIQLLNKQVQHLHHSKHQSALSLEKINNERMQCLQLILSAQENIKQLNQQKQANQDLLASSISPLSNDEHALQIWLEEMSQLDNELVTIQQTIANVQAEITTTEKQHKETLTTINTNKERLSQLHLDIESHRLRAESALELLQQHHQSRSEVKAEMPKHAKENIWQAHIIKVEKDINRLGPINLAAINEYDEQLRRKNYLDQQNEDLIVAISTLESAIEKIDKETRQKFKVTFDQINHDLKILFPKVFGGGNAYLDLIGEDLLDTGVSIMARPPGKKNSTIHLLSGGEKALTALSLVFAIFRLNPAPFCMLDEVDAPLDDANVSRFCNLVREMSQTVQFIYISHNKVAMEMATHLTGVTMFEPGVSKMVAVDIDEAIAMAEIS